jgi:CHAT domain-containing protein/tetratricopeptide (TPR) repeat protein
VLRLRPALIAPLALAGAVASRAVAADPFAECAARFERRPSAYESSYCFFQVAQEGRLWGEAARRLDALIARHPGNFWLTLARGNVEWTRDIGRAEALYRAAAEGFDRQGEPEGELLARYNLRTILFRKGRLEEAERELRHVLDVAEASGRGVLLARALTLHATHLADTGGDLGEAYRSLRRADEAGRTDQPYTLRRSILFALGNVCFQRGRFGEALEYYRGVDRMTAEAHDTLSRATAQYSVVNARMRELEELPQPGGRDEVLALARTALRTAVDADNRETQVLLHRTLGELLGARSPAEAEAHYDRCVALARSIHQPRELAHCLSSLGRHLAGEGRTPEARRRMEEALSLARETGEVWSLAQHARQSMRVSWLTRPGPEAIRESLEALEAIEALRRRPGDDSRAEVFSAWARDYHWLAGRLLDHGPGAAPRPEVELAFEIGERMRARALLEALSAARGGKDLPADQRADPRPARLEEIEQGLAEDEALLSFMIGLEQELDGDFGGGAWLTVSTRLGTRVHRVPDRLRLQAVVPVFLGLFESRDGRDAAPAASLFHELLEPALAGLPATVRRLVVIPDDALHRVPLAALRPSPAEEPLVARYEIALAPSATLWLRWRRAVRDRAVRPALVLADPAIARDGGGEPARGHAITRGSASALARSLGSLPHAREEGRSIVRRLGRGSELWLDAAASEEALKAAPLRQFAFLHLAAHAVVDDERPERSAVLLAPGPDREDGLLQLAEVVDLPLDGRAVVLSACRSATGSVLRGEGVVGFGRAFLEAGAHAVVGGLWPLRDDDAALLFDAFYRHLARGEGVGAALRGAQLESIRDGRPASAWAGLVVIGDGSLEPLPSEGGPAGFALLTVAAAGALLLWARRRPWRPRGGS